MAISAESAVRVAARAALDKKAIDVAVLDLQGLAGFADYFLVCSARSTTQADTIADVVVHVFLEATRGFYALDRLWGDAPLLSVEG